MREGDLLTDEHREVPAAVETKDVDRADRPGHHHARQLRNTFIDFMEENYPANLARGRPPAAQ